MSFITVLNVLAITRGYLDKPVTQFSDIATVVSIFPGSSVLSTSEVKVIVQDIDDSNSNMRNAYYI